MSELVGYLLKNQYFIKRFVEAGGMADVYQAWDQQRAAHVAVKVLRRALSINPRFSEMFAQEARLLQNLNHPNIVRLYDFGSVNDIAFIVMQWVDGQNVRAMIRNRPMSLNAAADIVTPVCRALHYAHQSNIFHCDVKPANILLDPLRGDVLLTDFGVARHAKDMIWGGTPVYMAPEQFPEFPFAGAVNAQTDVYAMGVTIFEMLTGGGLPYRGDTPYATGQSTRERVAWEIANVPSLRPRSYNQQIPPAVEQVILTALNKDPGARYSSILQLEQAFQAACKKHNRYSEPPTLHYPSERDGLATQAGNGYSPVQPPLANQNSLPTQHQPGHLVPGSSETLRGPNYPPSATPSKTQGMPNPVKLPELAPLAPATPGRPPNLPKGPYLLGCSGEWNGNAIEIPNNKGITIGRSSNCSVRLREPSVSRFHATVFRPRFGRRRAYIRDENSSLGVWVNDKRIAPEIPVSLTDGDLIRIGHDQTFEFHEK